MKPHWYSFSSRLGLLHAPYRMQEVNRGVEDGPRAILHADFLQKFPGSQLDEYVFSLPEQVHDNYPVVIAKDMQLAAHLIRRTLQPNETPVVIGGDHSVIFAGMNVILERFAPEQIGYIQFDSHADLNTFATSTTGNFHGIYLRAIVDSCGEAAIDALIPQKLPYENLLYIGNLDLDPEEVRLFAEKKIQTFDLSMVRQNPAAVQQFLHTFVQRFQHLHISFDIDMLDHSVAPATGIPCPHGFLLQDVFPLLDCITSAKKSLSVDLVEVNPLRKGAAQTITAAQSVLTGVLC